jgi:hypothetical protein
LKIKNGISTQNQKMRTLAAALTKRDLTELINDSCLSKVNKLDRADRKTVNDDPESILSLKRELLNDLDYVFSYVPDRQTWRHLENLMSENPFAWMDSVNEVTSRKVAIAIYEIAERYFQQKLIRNRKLDWFYMEIAIVMLFVDTLKTNKENDFAVSYPSLSRATDIHSASNISFFLYIARFVAINLIFVIIVLSLFTHAAKGSLFAGIAGGLIAAAYFFRWHSRNKKYKRLTELSRNRLVEVAGFYRILSAGDVHWGLVEKYRATLETTLEHVPPPIDLAIRNRQSSI